MNEEDEESLEEMRRRILDVRKGPRDTTSVSWIQVVRKMKEEKKEWVVLPSLAWLNQVIFKLKMIREKKEKEETERKETERKEKEEKEREREENLKRQWDSLPGLILLNIFCKSQLLDRLQSIPLVCKSWKYVSDDPRCWSSMIPDSVSPEDAFIKNTSGFDFNNYRLDNPDFEEEEEEEGVGISRLRNLIKKSGGGASIITLFLSPFISCSSSTLLLNRVILLIANCCPNLKHISYNVHLFFDPTSTESILQLFNRCKKLELVDILAYSYHPERDEALFIQDLGKCLPNLRGFRLVSNLEAGTTAASIATYLPQLKLLSFASFSLAGEHLSDILLGCPELQYLYVKGGRALEDYGKDIIERGSAQIPEFYYDFWHCDTYSYTDSYFDYDYDRSDDHNWKLDMQELNKGTVNCFEDHNSNETDYFCIDDYRDILKQRKEDQYVSILKEKMKRKKMYWCSNSSLKQKKKRNTTLKEKNINVLNYADYVIQ